jgi:rhomboid protease GluP
VIDALGANSYRDLHRGEIWRLVAHAFLHGGIIHILFNMFALTDLGRICEPLLGRERFSVVYIASAVAGGLASAGWAMLRHHGTIPSVGASGAICGLVGLLLGFSLRHRDRELRDQILRSVVYLAVLGFAIPHVDNAAHAGGLVTGTVFGLFTPRYVSSRSARLWQIPFWLVVAAAAASLGMAVWSYIRWPV